MTQPQECVELVFYDDFSSFLSDFLRVEVVPIADYDGFEFAVEIGGEPILGSLAYSDSLVHGTSYHVRTMITSVLSASTVTLIR